MERYANPIYEAANNWFLEDIIEPQETRRVLIKALAMLRTKKIIPATGRSTGISLFNQSSDGRIFFEIGGGNDNEL